MKKIFILLVLALFTLSCDNSGNIANNEDIPEILSSISSNLGVENTIEKTEFSWNYLDELKYPVSGYGLKLSNLSSTVYEQKMNELLEQYFSDWNGSVMNIGDGTYVSVLGKSKDSNVCVIKNGANNLPEDGEIIRENLNFDINISCGEIAEHKVADKTKLQINAIGYSWSYEIKDGKITYLLETGLVVEDVEIFREGNTYIVKDLDGKEYSKIWEWGSCEGDDGKYYNYAVSWELSGENGCGDVFAELSY